MLLKNPFHCVQSKMLVQRAYACIHKYVAWCEGFLESRLLVFLSQIALFYKGRKKKGIQFSFLMSGTTFCNCERFTYKNCSYFPPLYSVAG